VIEAGIATAALVALAVGMAWALGRGLREDQGE
jgi:hypothetical protein